MSPRRELALAVAACLAAAAATFPVSTALALVVLAAGGALLATRNAGRVAIGMVLIIIGIGVAIAALPAEIRTGWRILGLAAAVVVAAVGVVTVRRGRQWPSMGTRYERRADQGDGTRTWWEALDRGEDPTV